MLCAANVLFWSVDSGRMAKEERMLSGIQLWLSVGAGCGVEAGIQGFGNNYLVIWKQLSS